MTKRCRCRRPLQRVALLLVDQAVQRKCVGFLADVPVRRPGELAETGDAARLGHAGQAEIEPLGEQPRHQDAAVSCGLAGAQVGEAVRKLVQPATSASRSVMRMRGSMAYSRAARASASGGVNFSMGAIFSTPLLIVTSGSGPLLAWASTAFRRSSSSVRRLR